MVGGILEVIALVVLLDLPAELCVAAQLLGIDHGQHKPRKKAPERPQSGPQKARMIRCRLAPLNQRSFEALR